jgi:hypothetical protein
MILFGVFIIHVASLAELPINDDMYSTRHVY